MHKVKNSTQATAKLERETSKSSSCKFLPLLQDASKEMSVRQQSTVHI